MSSEIEKILTEANGIWARVFSRTVRNIAPPDFPTIVCLCGSTRFKAEYIKANFRETMKGSIVLSVGLYSHADKEVYDPTPEEKEALDRLHLHKVELSDEILIIDAPWWRCKRCKVFASFHPDPTQARIDCNCTPNINRGEFAPYIGESTRREIEYASSLGKTIRYLSQETNQDAKG